MVKLVKIRNMRHVFVDQVKSLISDHLSLVFEYQVNYFVGTNSVTGDHVLCFEVMSPQLGNVYRKTFTLKEEYLGGVPEELQEQFIGMIIGDFTLVSIGLITKDIVGNGGISKKNTMRIASKIVANPERERPFSKGGFKIFNPN